MTSYGDRLHKIYEINLSYLLLAQRLIKQDRYAACFTLGISDARIDILQDLTLPQLIHLASMDRLICQLRIDSVETLNAVTKRSRLDALQGVHTGIILSTCLLNALEKNADATAQDAAARRRPASAEVERVSLRAAGQKRL